MPACCTLGATFSERNGLQNGKRRLRHRRCLTARGLGAASPTRPSELFSSPAHGRRTGPRGASPGEELAGADAAQLAVGEQTGSLAPVLEGVSLGPQAVCHREDDCPTNLAEPALLRGRAAPHRTAGRPARRPAPAAPRAAAGTPAGSASGSTRSAWPRPLRGRSHQRFTHSV